MSCISSTVKTIQDLIRKDAGTYGDAQRLDQLGWMLFLKIFDDREKVLAVKRKGYVSPLPKYLRWGRLGFGRKRVKQVKLSSTLLTGLY